MKRLLGKRRFRLMIFAAVAAAVGTWTISRICWPPQDELAATDATKPHDRTAGRPPATVRTVVVDWPATGSGPIRVEWPGAETLPAAETRPVAETRPAVGTWPTTSSRPAAEVAGSLARRIEKLAEEYESATKSTVGLAVVDLRDGTPAALHRHDQPMIPASNQKLLTSAFAILRLGGEFKFTTGLFAVGDNLVLAGDGDPTLGDPVLAAAGGTTIYAELDGWAKQAREKFGQTVSGDLLARTQVDPKNMRHPDWPKDQYAAWFCAPVADLNFNNNCYDVVFRLDGEQISAVVAPASSYIKIACNVRRGDRQAWSLRSLSDESEVILSGIVKAGGGEPFSTSATNPPMMLARVLADRLEKAGVTFAGTVKAVKGSDLDISAGREIAATRTPLAAVLARANKNSLNMAAECVFLRAGDGTWKGSAKLMQDALAEKFGLDDQGLAVCDGSGLAQTNRVSPANIVKLLAAMAGGEQSRVFLESLPLSGVDGTMAGRMADRTCRGRVLGKTGTIAGASTLSGYILDGRGNCAFAYSILCNKVRDVHRARALQDAVCLELLAALAAAPAASQPATKK
ncbi:MAG: D-alanyl-D-alanine carboxypeptidase/D-alanyl-D-alanine-endopeptidase [Planctomycetes bacterium]|nr:D-alanyl-D-alanine carboxypeptidase/D-alanyl-D-alanine-endopeptidase [Planctomycetota bacterium]